MTKISSQSITCPKCQHEGEFRMYETVNVTLDKSLRERVFSDDLFKWTCPECGETFTIVYPFLYHDMDNCFMIHFSPNDCESINEQYNELLTKFPGMRRSTYRSTNALVRLKEKILIFEAGLNDVAIELAKVFIKVDEANKLTDKCSLVFQDMISGKGDSKKEFLVFKSFVNHEPQKGILLISRDQYDQYVMISQHEDFQLTRYCETINERWILSRMKKDES
jgi:hypothetical protein